MYKTCFECPHIREYHAGKPGRTSWYCPKLTKILGKYFFIDKMGHRPKICPLLKKKGEKNMKPKVNIKSNFSKTIVERVFDEAEYMLKNKAVLRMVAFIFGVSVTTAWRDMRKRLPYLNIGKYTQISELINSHKGR